MRLAILLLLALVTSGASGCHPECRWACDDPVCPASCSPQCASPACIIANASNLVCNSVVPRCTILCAPNQCESDSCPACEIQCDPPPVMCADGTILCEAPVCAWQCNKPDCRRPLCELQCEHPACEALSGATALGTSFLLLLLVLLALQ